MDEVGPNLFHASGRPPQEINAELVAIAVVRDELWRLPFFLAYHRWLGVQHFILIDNRSKDGTLDILRAERDVTCILAPGSYGGLHGQRGWLDWALRLAPAARWNLILDADELFVGRALRAGDLISLVHDLVEEGVSIAAASLVDCYPATFPIDAETFEPVPWQRAPYFDTGPYFRWPTPNAKTDNLYHGVRERLCWPHWRRVRQLKKIVPRPLRPRSFQAGPPLMIKTPLLQNAPGLRFRNVHDSAGAPRSKHLFCLLHYKFDLDLPGKVEVALRERQYSAGSREYEAYARFLSEPRFDLRFHGTRRFDGAQSLVEAGLAYADAAEKPARAGDIPLDEAVSQIWQHGDPALQRSVWESAWRLKPSSVPNCESPKLCE